MDTWWTIFKEDFDGEALGERYQGLGIFGYDSGARLFTTVWLDSLNTALALQKGHYLAEQNKFELTGEVYDPLLGRTKTTRSAIRVISHDSYELTMTDTAPNGAEFRSLEIRYARRADAPVSQARMSRVTPTMLCPTPTTCVEASTSLRSACRSIAASKLPLQGTWWAHL